MRPISLALFLIWNTPLCCGSGDTPHRHITTAHVALYCHYKREKGNGERKGEGRERKKRRGRDGESKRERERERLTLLYDNE